MSLPEDTRQEYLEALGIDSYFPRFKLPSAPESAVCEWPDSWITRAEQDKPGTSPGENDTEATTPQITGSVDGPSRESTAATPEVSPATNKTDHGAGDFRGVPQKPSLHIKVASSTASNDINAVENKATAKAEPAKIVKPQQDEIRLQLICIRISEELAILNAMPHFGPRQLPAQHVKLLQNFLLSCGFNLEAFQVEEKPFHWPMVQGEYVDNSKSAAASALVAYLQQKRSDWQFRNLLVMGEQVISRVFSVSDEQVPDEEIKSAPSLDEQSWNTFYTRSLDEIVQSPGLKKDAWSAIKKLQRT